jgi:hypothetical protein
VSRFALCDIFFLPCPTAVPATVSLLSPAPDGAFAIGPCGGTPWIVNYTKGISQVFSANVRTNAAGNVSTNFDAGSNSNTGRDYYAHSGADCSTIPDSSGNPYKSGDA